MKGFVCASVGLLLLGAAAQAGERDSGVSWTGFYIGVHGGYGWGKDAFTNVLVPASSVFSTPALILTGQSASGYLVGGHAGYNHQIGRIVGSIELDMSVTDIKSASSGSTQDVFGNRSVATFAEAIDYLGTVRFRIGFLPWPNLLFYGTAGPAWIRTTTDNTQTTVGSPPSAPFLNSTLSTAQTTPNYLFGFAGGVGIEVIVGKIGLGTVLARVEGMHHDFGERASSTVTTPFVGTTGVSSSGRFTVDVVRAGFSLMY